MALLVACVFLLVSASVALWTMPAGRIARLVDLPPQVQALEGYARDGRARLEGGYVLGWSLRPGELARLRIAADVALAGPDSALDGIAYATPTRWAAQGVGGRAGPGLLRLAPGLRLECDSRASVDIRGVEWSRDALSADGTIEVAEGTCRANGRQAPLPATRIVLEEEGDAARAVARTEDGAVLATLRATPARRATLRVEPAGAALVPGMPSGAATTLEFPF